MRPTIFAAATILGLALHAPRADARTVRDEPYPLDTTWNAAVRMVRVDFGFTIEERDRDLGYFTFQYREGRRTVPGSVEVLRTETDGRQGTRIIVQVPQMPTYVESMMLQHLSRKLRAEFGEPPPRRPTPSPERSPSDRPPSAEHPPDGAPTQPSPPAPPSQTPTSAAPTLTSGRWEPPPRIRRIEDFDD